jgi:hypothetical protein
LYDKKLEREVCLYNENGSACHYGEAIGLLAVFASIAFLAGEFLFDQMSSVKTRKHYVLLDLAFSGITLLKCGLKLATSNFIQVSILLIMPYFIYYQVYTSQRRISLGGFTN